MLFRIVWVHEGPQGLIHEPVSTWFKVRQRAERELEFLQQQPENAHKVLIVASLPTAQESQDESVNDASEL